MENRVDTHESFLNFLNARGYSKRTRDEYYWHYKSFKEMVNELGLTQEVLEAYINTRKGGKPVRAFMKCYLEFLRNKELEIPKRRGNVPKKRIDLPSEMEVMNIVEWLSHAENGDKFAIATLLAYKCGLRRQEICDIKIGDFNFEQFRDNTFKGTILKIHGKGSKERYVAVPQDLVEIIKEYLKNKAPQIKNLSWESPFLDLNGKWFQIKFQEACKKLGYKYTIHRLRHYRATAWYDSDVPLLEIRDRLGHSSVKTTETYLHPDESKALKKWLEESG